MEDGQVLHTSPYVTQIERFADSLKQLSHTFLQMGEKKQSFTSEEIDGMFEWVREKVCKSCEKCSWCWGENFVHTYQMGYEVLQLLRRHPDHLRKGVHLDGTAFPALGHPVEPHHILPGRVKCLQHLSQETGRHDAALLQLSFRLGIHFISIGIHR